MNTLCNHPNRFDGYCIHCWAERAREAEAACAEKQRILLKLHKEHLDSMAEVRDIGHTEGITMRAGDFCDVSSAIKDDCGQGWVSPEEAAKLRQERDALKMEYEIRRDLIAQMNKELGYDNSDGFHSKPDPFEIVANLKTNLTIAVEALKKIQMLTEAWNQISFQTIAKNVAKVATDAIDAIEKGTHHPDCDVLDRNPDGIKKPCNCP